MLRLLLRNLRQRWCEFRGRRLWVPFKGRRGGIKHMIMSAEWRRRHHWK